jgi:transposase
VDLAAAQRDMSEVRRVAVDETSKQRGHDCVTLVADADQRAVLFVTEGKDASTLERFAQDLTAHGGDPEPIESISMDMSAAFIKGATEQLPNAQITFDKFHIVAHASKALDETRRREQKIDPTLKGLRWKLLRDPADLSSEDRAEVEALARQAAGKRTARAWQYREELREILQRKQPNVVRQLLEAWCTGVMRSKVEPMKKVAKMIRSHLDGIVAWTRTRQTNGFLEAINGLFQAAKRRARGFTRFSTMRMVIFLIAGKLDFTTVNPTFPELAKPA